MLVQKPRRKKFFKTMDCTTSRSEPEHIEEIFYFATTEIITVLALSVGFSVF
jgi:hypothetical protein